jgi:hypothetical protein
VFGHVTPACIVNGQELELAAALALATAIPKPHTKIFHNRKSAINLIKRARLRALLCCMGQRRRSTAQHMRACCKLRGRIKIVGKDDYG